jgi:phage terminase large subunit GpA-like protein
MDAAIDPTVKRVVFVGASQLGKTELLLSIIGYRMDVDPAPVLFVSASQRLAESVSTSRVMPMIRSTPALFDKLDKSRSKLKITEKFLGGQRLGFGWAGSAIELSSHPAHTVLIDEVDRMERDVEGEGDPVSLAEARTATYIDGKVIVCSTPTIEGASPIWDLYSGGTQARWTWPCPDCLTFFAPELSLLQWDEKSTPQQAKRSARLVCPHCGSLIPDRARASMNGAGKYEITGDAESDTASFWVSGLCSPWRSWGECARAWVEAARSREPGRVQAIKNTVLGELYRLSGEAPEASKVQALRGMYRSDELPAGARVITCGVDVQKDRLYFAVRAWGAASTSWLIRYGELWGDTDQQSVWEALASLLEAKWGDLQIRSMLVDSGFRPDRAYAFARRFPGRVLPSKGHDEQARPVIVTRIDLDVRRNPSKRGTALAHVDANYFKSYVHGKVTWPLDQPGAWHLPADTGDDFCDSIVAESRIVKVNGKIIWVRDGQNRNDYLDCEALNAAAAHLLNVHMIRASKTAAQEAVQAHPTGKDVSPPSQSPDPLSRANRGPVARPQSNWVQGWRR